MLITRVLKVYWDAVTLETAKRVIRVNIELTKRVNVLEKVPMNKVDARLWGLVMGQADTKSLDDWGRETAIYLIATYKVPTQAE